MLRFSARVCAALVWAAVFAWQAGSCRAAAFASSDYRLAPSVDPAIAAGVTTEVWGTIWRPAVLSSPPYPLVVMLHGNHATCGRFDPGLGVRVDDNSQYTFSGTCPSGYVVAPSHRGYAYLAEQLASTGYIVVSINANRGINAAGGVAGDAGLNLRRGRLVLRHLQLLSQWNSSGGTPPSLGFDLQGKLDLSQVGLMGHSRGGEGMRAALAQYKDPGSPWKTAIGPVGFRALYEIAPVDGQTSRVLNAIGLTWNVLLPYCDGDVSDLQGVKPFDRMLRITKEKAKLAKSTFAVYGANHNFYNTEWQISDSDGCAGVGNTPLFPALRGSANQRQTALQSLVPLMRARVGASAQPQLAKLFNPDTPLPSGLSAITKIDRGYTDTPADTVELRIEDFDKPTGTSSSGQPELAQGIGIQHTFPVQHDASQRAAAITWSGAGAHIFQTNWTALGLGKPLSGFKTLEFRISRQCNGSCSAQSALNPTATTDFSVQLVRPDGSLSTPVALSSHLTLRGPVGYGGGFTFLHPTLFTARIPLSEFGLGAGASIRGVRYSFNATPTGAIYLANIRLSSRLAAGAAAQAVAAGSDHTAGEPAMPLSALPLAAGRAAIVGIRASAGRAQARSVGDIEIEIVADRPLPVMDSLPVLHVGSRQFTLSRYGDNGKNDSILFAIEPASFSQLPDGAPAQLQLGAVLRLDLGRLDKSMLR